MTEIIIEQIALRYFKGIREKDVLFNPQETTIKADNRVGKTTIFDAFTWVLFGKDSLGKTTFEIKTTDENGKTIPEVDHEVTAVLYVNGRKTTLRKAWRENWVKRRGAETAILDGHITECWWDGVPVGVTEYQARVNQILPEEIFKLVTNPLYFNSLKDDQKRGILIGIAGEISAEEIANGRPSFLKMLTDLSGKTVEDYGKMIASQRRQMKDELEQINPKISYQAGIIPEPLNWKELEGKKKEVEENVTRLIGALSNATELSDSKAQKIREHNTEISKIESQIDEAISAENKRRQNEAETANAASNGKKMELSDIGLKLRRARNDYDTKRDHRKSLQSGLETMEREKNALIEKYQTATASTYQENGTEITCPIYKHICTCSEADDHRRNDASKALESFNNTKAETLRTINKQGADKAEQLSNQKKSIAEAIEAETAALAEVEKLQKQYDELEQEISKIEFVEYQRVNRDTFPHADFDQRIQEQRDAIQAIKDANGTTETETLKQDLQQARTESETITKQLAVRDEIEAGKKRLSKLEDERKRISQELAELERAEMTVQEYQLELAAEIMRRVNKKFQVVQFRLFDTQINGSIKEVCDTLVNGVPYHSINNEARINAGIDIINVLCEIEQVKAPIWVDNRESVNILQPTNSQVINLRVSNDKELTII